MSGADEVDTAGIVTAQRQALDTMQNTLDQVAQAFVTSYLSKRDQDEGSFQDIETQVQQAASAYENTVNQAINQIDYKDSLQSQISEQIKKAWAGWPWAVGTRPLPRRIARLIPWPT